MEFRKDFNGEKCMFLGKQRNAEEMLHLYIFNYMKKRDLHKAAETFAKEANIEMLDLDYDENVLKDWWDIFWPQYCSRMTKQPRGHPQSSSQPSMKDVLEVLASIESPKFGSQTAQGLSQQRAGKHPMNTDTTSILGHSAASAKGKGPLGFPPVKLLPAEITPVPHSANLSYLQMPVTGQPAPQVVRAYRPVQLKPTYPAGQNVAYLPATPITGENNWRNQGSSTGVRVNAPVGTHPDSYKSQVPAAFFRLMQQGAEEHRQRSNPPRD